MLVKDLSSIYRGRLLQWPQSVFYLRAKYSVVVCFFFFLPLSVLSVLCPNVVLTGPWTSADQMWPCVTRYDQMWPDVHTALLEFATKVLEMQTGWNSFCSIFRPNLNGFTLFFMIGKPLLCAIKWHISYNPSRFNRELKQKLVEFFKLPWGKLNFLKPVTTTAAIFKGS